jgi:hypothetical protein
MFNVVVGLTGLSPPDLVLFMALRVPQLFLVVDFLVKLVEVQTNLIFISPAATGEKRIGIWF